MDEKTDVFAFGVFLLEIITGRKPVDGSHQSLHSWVIATFHKTYRFDYKFGLWFWETIRSYKVFLVELGLVKILSDNVLQMFINN